MVSSKRIVKNLMILVFAMSAWTVAAIGQTPSSTSGLSCPETVAVTEAVKPVSGWEASGGQINRQFERVSIFNGKRGGKEYELAPDHEKKVNEKIVQIWDLKDYRGMNVFLRCRYHETPAVLAMDLPPKVATCTFTFQLNGKNEFVGKSTLLCR